jgi:hypothetical protein
MVHLSECKELKWFWSVDKKMYIYCYNFYAQDGWVLSPKFVMNNVGQSLISEPPILV